MLPVAMTKRIRWRSACGLALWAPLLVLACGEEAQAPPEVVRSIKTVTVSHRPAGQLRRFSGVLAATDKSELSFRVSGRVQDVAVEAGAHVRSGQMLASIDPQPYELKVESAIADLRSARARLSDAEKKFESTRSLYDRRIASKLNFDSAEAAFESAQSAMHAAEAALNLAQRDLDNSILLAPFDGLVAERHIEPFQQVNPGQTILLLHTEGAIEVDVRMPEGLIHDVAVGQQVTVRMTTASFRGQRFRGSVNQVGATALEANSYPVTIAVENADPRMRPGMTARVDFTFRGEAQETGWLVPANAVLSAQGSSDAHISEREFYVFVYQPESSSVARRKVQVVGIHDRDFEVAEGLSEGDVVAVAGVHFLRDGQRVSLLQEDGR
jgi:RND family efflux transporter MFP subunit